ncbi:MAG: PAS domain-containing protein, partial [Verrucomicrobia bacterium]|nr:PAS domain-containing protein [Verrucomicrobiota bacterium]
MSEEPISALPLCLVCSDDGVLCRQLAGLLHERAYLIVATAPAKLRSLLAGADPVLLFLDLRQAVAPDLISELAGPARARIVTVALGVPGSAPFTASEDARLYRVEDLAAVAELRALRTLADAALDRVVFMQENGMLRSELARVSAQAILPPAAPASGNPALGLQQVIKPARHHEGLEPLFEKIIDGVASAVMVTRVGLFYSPREGQSFKLKAGRYCLDYGLEFSADDPFARWLERNAQPISRRSLEWQADPSARLLLRRALDLLGAESLIPLHLRGRLVGWIFTGQPFDGSGGRGIDFHSLALLCEHVTAALENTTLYQDTELQKTLTETLLQMLPAAIIAVEPDGVVRWANGHAERLFPVLGNRRRGLPPPIIEDLNSRIAGLVHAALSGDPLDIPLVWEAANTARTFSARAHTLNVAGQLLGVFVLVEDITEQLMARAYAEADEWQTLCGDLSAGLAHEIRNPLVALKTFAQLLPQRHSDPEFREEFSDLIEREIGRLDALLNLIERFAHPPENEPTGAVREPLKILDVLKTAQDLVMKEMPQADARFKLNPRAGAASLQGLPTLIGDPGALVQCFRYLFINGIEAALRKSAIPVITIDIVAFDQQGENGGVRLAVSDNGPGIEPALRPRIFSPFCTTKNQGLGLGLPLAQRIILAHGGRIELDPGSRGTCVNIVLPLRPQTKPAGWAG